MKKVAILSGKGGTGKTSLSASLTLALSTKKRLKTLDCDVESPNLELLLDAEPHCEKEKVYAEYPRIDHSKCTYCGRCARVCNFNALVVMSGQKKVMVWDDLCHSCGACWELCPEKAIGTERVSIGEVRFADVGNTPLVTGESDIGKMMPDPVISAVKNHLEEDALNIIDSPPGTSCPVVKSAVDADAAILVAEPSPFGIHDMKLAMELLEELKKKYYIVINKSMDDDEEIFAIAEEKNVKVLGTIPFDLKGAKSYSKGDIRGYYEHFKDRIDGIAASLISEVKG